MHALRRLAAVLLAVAVRVGPTTERRGHPDRSGVAAGKLSPRRHRDAALNVGGIRDAASEQPRMHMGPFARLAVVFVVALVSCRKPPPDREAAPADAGPPT